MYSVSVIAFGVFLAFTLYKLAAQLVDRFQKAAKAKSLGCKPAPTFPSPDPLGLINLYRLYQSNEAGQLPEFVIDRVNVVSAQEGHPAFTFQTHIVRNWLFFTCDPKNIQALLATQFKDFEFGPIRYGTFSPL